MENTDNFIKAMVDALTDIDAHERRLEAWAVQGIESFDDMVDAEE